MRQRLAERGSLAVTLIAVATLATQVFGARVLLARWQTAGHHLYPNDEITLYEQRFEGMRAALPARGVVGYVEDKASGWRQEHKAYLLTQYALAPLIVIRSSATDLVVGNFHDRAGIHSVALEPGLAVRDRFPGGLVLLQAR